MCFYLEASLEPVVILVKQWIGTKGAVFSELPCVVPSNRDRGQRQVLSYDLVLAAEHLTFKCSVSAHSHILTQRLENHQQRSPEYPELMPADARRP